MGLKKAIKDTVEYAANFGSYINKNEIKERLISQKIFSKKEINKLLKQYKNKKNKWYKQKFNRAMVLAKQIENDFKDILFLGISGSVASGHPKKNDDIDLLIITKTNKLWKTRLGLRWWIFKKRLPHRKYNQKERKNEFCFNLWLESNYLLLPKNRHNLKNSVDLMLLKPLINKGRIYEKFILTNDWAKKWVATPYKNKMSNFQFLMSNEKQRINKLDKITNYLYFWPQYWYMKRKIKGETIGLHQAFFLRQMVK